MPVIANYITVAAVISAAIIIYAAWKASSIEKKTVMGCLLYLNISVLLMSPGQWKKPQTFYIKYESAHIEDKIKTLEKEREKILELKQYMIKHGMFEEEKDRKENDNKKQYTTGGLPCFI